MAILLQHPSAKAILRDPRDPPVRDRYRPSQLEVAAAKRTHDAERIAAGLRPDFTAPTDEEWERLAAHEAIYALLHAHGFRAVLAMVDTGKDAPAGLLGTVEKYGRARVRVWVWSLATIAGCREDS